MSLRSMAPGLSLIERRHVFMAMACQAMEAIACHGDTLAFDPQNSSSRNCFDDPLTGPKEEVGTRTPVRDPSIGNQSSHRMQTG